MVTQGTALSLQYLGPWLAAGRAGEPATFVGSLLERGIGLVLLHTDLGTTTILVYPAVCSPLSAASLSSSPKVLLRSYPKSPVRTG